MSYIDKALQTGRKVNMIYVAQSGVMTKRIIRILSYTDEKIVVYCYMRNQIRTFNRMNVLAMELMDDQMEAYA